MYKKPKEIALNCPAILEQSKEAIDQCHLSVQGLVREVVSKLLAQKGIVKPSKKHRKYSINFNSIAFRDKHSVENELKLSLPRPDQSYVENDLPGCVPGQINYLLSKSNGSSDVSKQTTSESSSNGDHVNIDERNHISAVMARQFPKEMEGVTMTKDHDTITVCV